MADIDQKFVRDQGASSRPSSSGNADMSTTPQGRGAETERILITPKIYVTPESLTIEEAYAKVYSSRIRYGHRQEISTHRQAQDNLQLHLMSEYGELEKVISEDGKDFEVKRDLKLQDEANFAVYNKMIAAEVEQILEEPSSPGQDVACNQNEMGSDSVIAAKRNVSSTSIKWKDDVNYCVEEPGARKLSESSDDILYMDAESENVDKQYEHKEETEAPKISPTLVKELEALFSIDPNLNSPSATKIEVPSQFQAMISNLEPTAAAGEGMFESVTKNGLMQRSSSSSSSRTSWQSQKTAIYRGKHIETRYPPRIPQASQNRLQSKPPFKSAMKNRGESTQSSDPGISGTRFVPSKNSKDLPKILPPLLQTPSRLTPKLSRTFKASALRPCPARRLELPNSDVDLSPMASPTSVKKVEEKSMVVQRLKPKPHSCVNRTQTCSILGGSYAEQQKAKMAKMELAKKSLNDKITRHHVSKNDPAVDSGLDFLKPNCTEDPNQSNVVQVAAGISEQGVPTFYESGDDMESKKMSSPKPKKGDKESTTVVFKMENSELSQSTTTQLGGDTASTFHPIQGEISASDLNTTFTMDPSEATPSPQKYPQEDVKVNSVSLDEPKSPELPSPSIDNEGNTISPANDPITHSKALCSGSVAQKLQKVTLVPCKWKASGCTESVPNDTLSKDNHHRECTFRPIPCFVDRNCARIIPYHSFLCHVPSHFLTSNLSRSLITTVYVNHEDFSVHQTWTPKWLRIPECSSNFFLMLNRTPGRVERVDGTWMCWIWMLGSQEEASKFYYSVDLFKGERKIEGTFTTQSIRTGTNQIMATKSCLCFTDRIVEHLTDIGDKCVENFGIYVSISRKPDAATTESYTGQYRIP